MQHQHFIIIGVLFMVFCFKKSMCMPRCLNGTDLSESHDGICYVIVTTQRNWMDSCKYCHSLGGQLVTINTSEKQQFLKQLITNETYSFNLLYIGGYSDGKVFRWMESGQEVNNGSTYWLGGIKPTGVDKTTMVIGNGHGRGILGSWYYNNIDFVAGSICQVTSNKGPFTCPKLGTPIGCANSTDLSQSHNGICYVIVTTPRYWLDSCKYCHSIGGQLVTIDTSDKQIFLSQMMTTNKIYYSSHFLYIGGYSDGKVFRWIDSGKEVNNESTYWLGGTKQNGVGKTTMVIGNGQGPRGVLGSWYYNNIDFVAGSICQVTSNKGPFTCPKLTSSGNNIHYSYVWTCVMILMAFWCKIQ